MTQMNPNFPANPGIATNGPIPGAGYDKLGDALGGDGGGSDQTAGLNDDAVNDLVPDEVSEHGIDPRPGDATGDANILNHALGDGDPSSDVGNTGDSNRQGNDSVVEPSDDEPNVIKAPGVQ